MKIIMEIFNPHVFPLILKSIDAHFYKDIDRLLQGNIAIDMRYTQEDGLKMDD